MYTKRYERNKAQLTFVNLVVVAVVLLMYFTFIPVTIVPAINSFVASEAGDTNPLAPAIIVFAQAVPLLLLIAIIVGAFIIATPRYQGGQY